MLGGKTVIQAEAMIRGDLARSAQPPSSSGAAPASNTAVAIGRYCFLSKGCCLRPPGRQYKGFVRFRLRFRRFPLPTRACLPPFSVPYRAISSGVLLKQQQLQENKLQSVLIPLVCSRIFTYLPLRLGDHVFVGEGAVIQAATVGSHVHIGREVVVGEFAIIKDYVRVLDGAVIPPNMVIPSFSIVAGQPARIVGEVPEGGHEAFELRELYKTVGNNPQPLPV